MDADTTKALARRAPGVVSRELGGEFVVLDPDAGTAHRLHGDAARLWRTLTGPVLIDLESAEAHVLADLDGLGLVTVTGPDDAVATASASRAVPPPRRAVLQAGAMVATAAVVTGIETIVLPSAAHAASNGVSFTAPASGTFEVLVNPPVSTLSFSLSGAGGGGGGSTASGATGGGPGGAGTVLTGTITIDRQLWPDPVHVTVVVGAGGRCGGNGGNGGSGFGDGGNGYLGGAAGGGGGSAIIIENKPYLVAPGGGGGGANSPNGNRTGGNGGNGGLVNANGSSGGDPGGLGDGGGLEGDRADRGRGGSTARAALDSVATGGAGGANDGSDGTVAGADGSAGGAGSLTIGGGGGPGGNGGHNAMFPDRASGGGGGGGWGGGGGGEAGTQNLAGRSGAGGGGASALYFAGDGFTITFPASAVGSAGGLSGEDGQRGTASLQSLP